MCAAVVQDQTLIVKNGFLECVDKQGPRFNSRRQRSCTDSQIDAKAGYGDNAKEGTSSGSLDVAEEIDYHAAARQFLSPGFFPATPEFSPLCHPSAYPASLKDGAYDQWIMPTAYTPDQINWPPGQFFMPPMACDVNATEAPLQRQSILDNLPKNLRAGTLPTIAEKEAPMNPDAKTTVMLRGLPQSYTRADLLDLLDAQGFYGRFNFIYLPMDFKRQRNLGYALVNLVLPSEAVRLSACFEGFSQWKKEDHDVVCEATWCNPHQGLEAHVERYKNSPVMHESVPEEWRPMLLKNGVPIPFPPPTIKIKCPKLKGKA